jgi:acyl phosphate:glycerol-3-phosphate acyltransferase
MELFPFAGREVVLTCLGYILGCFSPGYYLVKYRTGKDIRALHSGSTGGTNVGRILGTNGYLLTLSGDALKASLALGTARYFGLGDWGIASVIVAVIAGHIWPAQLRFHGGKGLAPALGIIAVLDYRAALIMCAIAILGSLARCGKGAILFAACISPAVIALLNHGAAEISAMTVLAVLVLIAHRDNIRDFFAERRGRKGQEA